jgi:hypothetical protein
MPRTIRVTPVFAFYYQGIEYTLEKPSDRCLEVLRCIRDNPEMSRSQVARLLYKTSGTISATLSLVIKLWVLPIHGEDYPVEKRVAFALEILDVYEDLSCRN